MTSTRLYVYWLSQSMSFIYSITLSSLIRNGKHMTSQASHILPSLLRMCTRWNMNGRRLQTAALQRDTDTGSPSKVLMTTLECPYWEGKPKRRSRLSFVLLITWTAFSNLAHGSSAFQPSSQPPGFPIAIARSGNINNRYRLHDFMLYDSSQDETSPQPKKKKKKKSFTINPSLSASISSNGILTDHRMNRPVTSSSLGVPSKTKNKVQKSTTSTSMSKEDRQRTGNGAMNGSRQTLIASPESEDIQVLEAKRGPKTVTIVRGMTSPMEDRKRLLKAMKQSLGVGGTLVDGVLEIQGSHAAKVVATLKVEGYSKAKRIGK